MSKYSVIVTKPAADDAVEIIRYISDNLKNRKAAERHLELYLDTLRSLREMPGIYLPGIWACLTRPKNIHMYFGCLFAFRYGW